MIISLEKVSFRYFGKSRPALQQISFAVGAGEILGVLGASGAGKSTLCLLLSGFMPQFFNGDATGQVRVDGQDVLERSPADLARTVGLVLSDPFSQISGTCFSAFEEVAFGLENLGLPRAEIGERCEWALATLGIAGLRDRSPYSLSGGQQQRLVLAAVLAMRPRVLILDQPAAQLDQPALIELGATLRSLSAGGTTILIAEARASWLARVADRMLVLNEGEITADGAAAEVLHERPPAIPARCQAQIARPSGYEPPLIALERVSYSYPGGVSALRDISLQIGRGERIALVGRNGAGKSTLIRHLNGLLRPDTGRVLVQGTDTRSQTVARCARSVALTFQDVRNQLFSRTVRQELAFGPRNLGYPPERCAALVEQALAATGLGAYADEHPYDLQPQQRRFVAIATALAMATPLLVLDEPGAGMDDTGIRRLAAIIDRHAEAGGSVIVVSHDIDFCGACSNRVLLLVDGQLVVDGFWAALNAQQRATLETEVGLPSHSPGEA